MTEKVLKFRIKVIYYYDAFAVCKEEALEQLWNNEADFIRSRTVVKKVD